MAKKNKSMNKTGHTIAYVFSIICITVFVIVSYLTYKTVLGMNIIPVKYTNIFLYVLIGISILFGLIAILPKVSTFNKVLQILICFILSVGLMVVNTRIPDYLGRLERMFNRVPDEGTLFMNIYVPVDSEISDVKDLENRKIGVLSDKDSEYLEYSYKVISRELNGATIEPVSYTDVYKLAEDFQNDVVEGILINQTYAQFISENNDFSEYNNDNKIIYTIEHKIKLNYETNEVGNITKEPFVVAVSGNDTWDYSEMDPSQNIARSDVNMLVVVNPLTKKILIVNIPRDTYVPLFGDYDAMDKLTHATIYGIDTWEKAVNELLDIDIIYFVRINFQSFVNVVDAVGGIDIDNPDEMTIGYVEFDKKTGIPHGVLKTYEKGLIHLTGPEALGYVRERKSLSEGDIARTSHQAIAIKGLIDKVTQVSVITKVSNLLDAVNGTFMTDMNINKLYALIQMQLDDMASWEISSFGITGYEDERTSYAMGNSDVEIEEEVEVEVLIVDEEGNPILDEDGNEQYEIRVEKQKTTQEARTFSVLIPYNNDVSEAKSLIQQIMSEKAGE